MNPFEHYVNSGLPQRPTVSISEIQDAFRNCIQDAEKEAQRIMMGRHGLTEDAADLLKYYAAGFRRRAGPIELDWTIRETKRRGQTFEEMDGYSREYSEIVGEVFDEWGMPDAPEVVDLNPHISLSSVPPAEVEGQLGIDFEHDIDLSTDVNFIIVDFGREIHLSSERGVLSCRSTVAQGEATGGAFLLPDADISVAKRLARMPSHNRYISYIGDVILGHEDGAFSNTSRREQTFSKLGIALSQPIPGLADLESPYEINLTFFYMREMMVASVNYLEGYDVLSRSSMDFLERFAHSIGVHDPSHPENDLFYGI